MLAAGAASMAAAQNRAEPPARVPPTPARPLVLTEAIPLEGVKGRFDHFASGGGMLFVSALGNNSVEVINTGGRVRIHSIPVPDPQGLAYSPETKKLFVGSGSGKLYIYDGTSFAQLATIDFPGGADNVRYDAAHKRIYVACGDEQTGAIAAVDPTTNQRLKEEYPLGGEPESFQLEQSGPNIYVNLPGKKEIAVINRVTKAVTHWPLTVEGNFPMALDEADHRLFIGTHEPPRMVVLDTSSGRMITAMPSVQDTDDLYFSANRKRIYMPGGEGFIYVFQMKGPDDYQLLAKVPTAIGARTAGYFGVAGKGFDRFYLAVPARGSQSAEIRIYTAQDE
jgi:DNA-binding beta-propeller fold protein YncE